MQIRRGLYLNLQASNSRYNSCLIRNQYMNITIIITILSLRSEVVFVCNCFLFWIGSKKAFSPQLWFNCFDIIIVENFQIYFHTGFVLCDLVCFFPIFVCFWQNKIIFNLIVQNFFHVPFFSVNFSFADFVLR